MAVITVNKKEFLNLVGKKLSDKQIEDAINKIGMDFEEMNGNEIIVDITANRPDLLSQCGLARAVSSYLGIKKGLRKYDVKKEKYVIKAEGLPSEWPYVAGAVVKGLKLSDEKIKEIIQLQEKLDATFLRNRKKGGLGIYPLEGIKWPVKFKGVTPNKVRFRPLEFPRVVGLKEILEQHKTGRKYAHIMKGWKKCTVFIDADDKIMSMPPIINSHDLGKVTEKTTNVFVEATGTDFNAVMKSLNIFVASLADMGGKVYANKVIYGKKSFYSPDFKPEEFKFDVNYINKLIGFNLKLNDMNKMLLKMGYGLSKNKNCALVPAYRADVLHQTDLAEDIAIAYDYDNLKPEIPKVATIANESKIEVFKKKVANILVGLGLLEVHTYNLTSKHNQVDRMNCDIKCVELANALNEDYNVLRAWVTPSLLQILSENKHNEYPQNLFGFGDVFKYDSKEESGVSEDCRLSVVLCHSSSNFTEIKQVLDVLAKSLDFSYKIKEVNHGSFIPGRVGRVSVNNKDVAYIGEVHPQVLENFELEVPVVALEINLSEVLKIIK